MNMYVQQSFANNKEKLFFIGDKNLSDKRLV